MQKRAYTINNPWSGKTVVGGSRAGRFYSNGTNHRKVKSVRKSHSGLVRGMIFIFIMTALWIICSRSQVPTFQEQMKTKYPIVENVAPVEVAYAAEPVVEVPQDAFDKYFGAIAGQAREVARCESSMNPDAVGSTFDYGIMQINYKTWGKVFDVTRAQLLDRDTNIRLASLIYQRSGNWSAWKSSYKCHGLK